MCQAAVVSVRASPTSEQTRRIVVQSARKSCHARAIRHCGHAAAAGGEGGILGEAQLIQHRISARGIQKPNGLNYSTLHKEATPVSLGNNLCLRLLWTCFWILTFSFLPSGIKQVEVSSRLPTKTHCGSKDPHSPVKTSWLAQLKLESDILEF